MTFYTNPFSSESVAIFGFNGLNDGSYSSKLFSTKCNRIFKRKPNVDIFLKYILGVKSNNNYYALKDLNDLYKLL